MKLSHHFVVEKLDRSNKRNPPTLHRDDDYLRCDVEQQPVCFDQNYGFASLRTKQGNTTKHQQKTKT